MKSNLLRIVFLLFVLMVFLLNAGQNQVERLLRLSQLNIQRNNYVSAYQNLLEAKNLSANNNHQLSNVYFKLGELCEITNNYDSAVFYFQNSANFIDNDDKLNEISDRIININSIKNTNPQNPVSLTQRDINLHSSPHFQQNIRLNTERQSFRVQEPVKVAGVRGADELKIDENLVYENLQVNLQYLTFTEEEVENFLKLGNLQSYETERERLSVRQFVVSQDEEIRNGEISAQVLINNFIEQNRYCSVDRLNHYPVKLKRDGTSNTNLHTERIYYINLLYKTLTEQTTRPDLMYKVDIFFDENINAFTTTSGYVFISESFLNIMNNEDELAAVLAHELAHITMRHHAAASGTSRVTSEAARHLLRGRSSDVQKAASVLDNTLISNSFERRYEYEADEKAVEYLIKLGYNPFALITLLEAFLESERINNRLVGSFMNNHPHPNDRIERLKNILKDYDEYDFYTNEFYLRKARFHHFMKNDSQVDLSVIKDPVERPVIKEEKESSPSDSIKKELRRGLRRLF